MKARKIRGCKLNKITAQVILEILRNDTKLDGKEINDVKRKIIEKCNVSKSVKYA